MALKASPDDQAHLLEVQAIDTKLRQLDHRAKTLPQLATLASIATETEQVRLVTLDVTGRLEDARAELARIESDVSLVETRITRDDARLQSSSSVKDVAGLESELTGLRRRRDELEEIELAVMERVEELEKEAAATSGASDDLRTRVTEVELERDAALAALASERSHAQANRQTIVAKLPVDLMALFDRQQARYGFGASLLRGGVSEASGVRMLENELARVRAAAPDDVLICPDSQAILVRTNESGI
ncbi:MAG: hypothetical protein RI885_1760 [Actinomycetota bacterium]|jgi:predicted  nucleic acid-binding Zn-ribbon protein